MLTTGIIGQCAAALCATMSPQPAEPPPEPSTPVEAILEDTTPSVEAAPVEFFSAPVVQPVAKKTEAPAASESVPMVATYPQASANDREVECLALNIYHEARGEPTRGRYAVAWVTVNRARSAQFPSTVCEVVYQKTQNKRGRWVAQFSWTLQNPAAPQGAAWSDAQRIASEVYNQRNSRSGTYRLSNGVMYYHATSGVSRENLNWFRSALRQIVRIGDHIFYTAR